MHRSFRRVALCCGLLTLATSAEGCQRRLPRNLVPVEGILTKDGRPLGNIEVVFVPDLDAGTQGMRSSAITDEAGHYYLQNDTGGDGAVTGKYRVVIHDLEAFQKRMSKQEGHTSRGPQQKLEVRLAREDARRLKQQKKTVAETSRVPPSYERFNETPLRAEVNPGLPTLDFNIP